jgi:hypothetical protein
MSEKELEKMNKFFQHLTDRACEANLPELAKDISEEFTEEDWQHDQESRQ